MSPRLTATVVLTLLAWFLTSLLGAQPASAHAALVASTPSELAILTDAPSSLLLVFDEDVAPALSQIAVIGPRHAAVRVGAATHGHYDGHDLVVPVIGAMAAGDYQVDWRAVSTDDGHPTFGSFSFRTLTAGPARAALVDKPRAPVLAEGASGGLVYGAARWLAFLGFAAGLGASYFVVACWPAGRSRRPMRALVTGGYGVLVIATAAMFFSYGPYAAHAPISAAGSYLGVTASSHLGKVLLLRLDLLVALACLGLIIEQRRKPLPGRVTVLGAGALLAATWSAISHSESSAHAAPLVVLDVVHLVATAVWLGGLAALGLAVLRESDETAARAAVDTFSTTALLAVGVLVGTGLVQAWQRVGTLAALTDNEYARLLLGKVALVGVTLGLAWVARFRLLRRPTWAPGVGMARLRRVVMAEAALGVAVLGVTSVLVTAEPARLAHAQVIAARSAAQRTVARAVAGPPVTAVALKASPLSGTVPYDAGVGPVGTGTVDLTVLPPHTGPTEIHVTVLDATGAPRALTTMTGALRRTTGDKTPVAVRFTELSAGHYVSQGAAFTVAGRWQLGIAFRLPSGAGAIAVAGISVA